MKKLLAVMFAFGFLFVGFSAHEASAESVMCPTGGTPFIQVANPGGGEIYQAGQQITVGVSTCNIPGNISEINLIAPNMVHGQGMTLVKNVPQTNGLFSVNLPTEAEFANSSFSSGDPFKLFKIEVVTGSSALNNILSGVSNNFTIKTSNICEVTDFSVTPMHINLGDSVVIRWAVSDGCTSTTLNSSNLDTYFGPSPSTGSRTVYPKADTIFNIMTTDGTISTKSVDVTVSVNIPTTNYAPIASFPVAPEVSSTGARLESTVTFLGTPTMTARGTCYSLATAPESPSVTNGAVCTTSGVTSLNTQIVTYPYNLTPNTTYKFRGYATNGVLTGYSTEATFTTLPAITPTYNNGCSNGEIYSSTTGQVCPTTTNTNPLITIFNPSVGSTYTAGQTIPITWTSGAPGLTYITFYKSDSSYSTVARVTNNPDTSGYMTYTFPTNMPAGKYKVYAFNEVTVGGVTNSKNLYESNGYFNIVSSVVDNGCSYGAVYSYTTGQVCPSTSIPNVTAKDLLTNNSIKANYLNKQIILEGYLLTYDFWRDWTKTNFIKTDSFTLSMDSLGASSKWVDVAGGNLNSVNSLIVDKWSKYSPSPTWLKLKIKGILRSRDLSTYGMSLDSQELVELSKVDEVVDNGCLNGAAYSYTTGARCPIINTPICPANMPNPLALCSDGRIEAATKDANNCTTSFRCTNPRNDLGCKNNEKYSSITKQTCPMISTDNGCSGTNKFSSTNGAACLINTPEVDGGCNGINKYSLMTGRLCSNFTGVYTPVIPNTIDIPITRTLKLGTKGDDVKALQAFLNLLADGSFGPKTQAKVIEWQAAHGLTADGAFGRMSRQKAGLTQ